MGSNSTLNRLRRINLLTLREVSEHLGMNLNSYAKIERGERGLSLQNAIKLRDLYKLSCIDELLEPAPEQRAS